MSLLQDSRAQGSFLVPHQLIRCLLKGMRIGPSGESRSKAFINNALKGTYQLQGIDGAAGQNAFVRLFKIVVQTLHLAHLETRRLIAKQHHKCCIVAGHKRNPHIIAQFLDHRFGEDTPLNIERKIVQDRCGHTTWQIKLAPRLNGYAAAMMIEA